MTFDDLEILACVYGPGSTAADIARMQAVGEGWVHGIDQWVQSGAPYLLLVGCNFGGASHSRPTVILAQDHDQAEQAIWAAMQHADSRLCLLETFEPSLRSFVDAVIEASRRPAGHA